MKKSPGVPTPALAGLEALSYPRAHLVRVLVFANAEAVEIARQAGADYVGEDDLIERIEGGWMDFDVGLAVPQVMPKIGRLGRILGRSGLMPNPRSGTMVQPQDLPRVIQEAKAGRVEYRTDRTAIIHSAVGKVSFESEKLVDNLASLVSSIVRDKPTAVGPWTMSLTCGRWAASAANSINVFLTTVNSAPAELIRLRNSTISLTETPV